jgi:hypothetical protein
VKCIIEERREFNLKTHLAFVVYEKTFDKVKRTIYLRYYMGEYTKLFIRDCNKYVQK